MPAGLVYKDRVKETTTSTGTGTITLAGAATGGFVTFDSVCIDGQQVYYTIDDGAGNWEVGRGTFTHSGTTLSRDVIKASSNANAAVNFSAGTKNVWLDQPADTYSDMAMTVAFAMKAVPQ